MNKAAVDSSVILDILLDDPKFAEPSMKLLGTHIAEGAVVICPVAYSESAACLYPASRFVSIAKEMGLIYEDFDPEVCALAAQMWRDYHGIVSQKCPNSTGPASQRMGEAELWVTE